jgi:hypothetical protein
MGADVTTPQAVAGNAPLTFTDSLGSQRSVPLSALQFSGSTLGLTPEWSSSGVLSAADTTTLLALAGFRVATGDLTPAPVPPPVPALSFTAAAPGPQGNNITVKISSVTGPTGQVLSAVNATLVIDASETDTYSGLTSATDAANAIGVDTAPSGPDDPPQGGGVVVVQSGGATGTGLPEDGQTLTVTSKGTNVLAADGKTTLFVLAARNGYTGTGINTTVSLAPGGKTFSVTATYDAGNTNAVAETDLGSLPGSVTFLVSVAAPPGGLALPTAGTTTLSGGAAGLLATGFTYTG